MTRPTRGVTATHRHGRCQGPGCARNWNEGGHIPLWQGFLLPLCREHLEAWGRSKEARAWIRNGHTSTRLRIAMDAWGTRLGGAHGKKGKGR